MNTHEWIDEYQGDMSMDQVIEWINTNPLAYIHP